MAHTGDCEAVSTFELPNCPTAEGGCTLRYAHDSVKTNYISKLTTAYERDLGVTHDRNGTLRTGNSFRNDVDTQYMAFVREEQGKAGAKVPQAPARLRSHLAAIAVPGHFACSAHKTLTIGQLARDIALLTVASSTTNRGDGLSRTLIQRILRPPNNAASALISNGERRCGTAPIIP